MKISDPLYCCNECKKVVPTLDKLLFVEEHSNKGFCSEECIEFFYTPFLAYYDQFLLQLRIKHQVTNENFEIGLSDKDLVEEIIRAPTEVWRTQNELHEENFTYIKHFPAGSAGIVCTVLHSEPSFIFLVFKSKSAELLAEFRGGERIVTPRKEDRDHIVEELEIKKSHLLADLLSKRKETDIPFEEFTNYDNCLLETMNHPDEIFEYKDKEGDLLTTTIKSFLKNNKNFFYIIISYHTQNILSFPTEDMNLYAEFRVGKLVKANLKN